MSTYYITPVSHGSDTFHVRDHYGIPLYDGAPDGKDKPLVFHDADTAQECADRLNSEICQHCLQRECQCSDSDVSPDMGDK